MAYRLWCSGLPCPSCVLVPVIRLAIYKDIYKCIIYNCINSSGNRIWNPALSALLTRLQSFPLVLLIFFLSPCILHFVMQSSKVLAGKVLDALTSQAPSHVTRELSKAEEDNWLIRGRRARKLDG